MPHYIIIARCRAQISGLYSDNFGLMKHKSSLCPQGAPNALHHLQVYLLPHMQAALVAYVAGMVGAATAPLAYAGYTGLNTYPAPWIPVPTVCKPYVPYINGAYTCPYPYTPYPIGCSYTTPYLAAPGVAFL